MMPTGLFGPALMRAFECFGFASQNSFGLYLNTGRQLTDVTFQSPIGNGSCSLPVVTGAKNTTEPSGANTRSAESSRVTRIVTSGATGFFGGSALTSNGITAGTAISVLRSSSYGGSPRGENV